MSDAEDERAEGREVILILRLMLDRSSRLRRGELLDADAIQQGRFVTFTEMLDETRRWLERLQKGSLPNRGENEERL